MFKYVLAMTQSIPKLFMCAICIKVIHSHCRFRSGASKHKLIDVKVQGLDVIQMK